MTELIPAKGIETKAAGEASGTDVALAFDDFMMAFEAFKETNDERLSQIEDRVSADVLTSEKLERINKALDENKALADTLQLFAGQRICTPVSRNSPTGCTRPAGAHPMPV